MVESNIPSVETLEKEWSRAQGSPSEIRAFRRLYLGEIIDDTAAPVFLEEDIVNVETDEVPNNLWKRSVILGVDLSNKVDLTAISFVYLPEKDEPIFARTLGFMASDRIADLSEEDSFSYGDCVENGFVVPIEGSVIHKGKVLDYLIENENFLDKKIIGVVADPWALDDFVQEMRDRKIPVNTEPSYIPKKAERQSKLIMAHPQGFRDKATYGKLIFRSTNAYFDGYQAIKEKDIILAENNLLRRAAMGFTIQMDGHSNYKWTKAKSWAKIRIDPFVALIMGISAAKQITKHYSTPELSRYGF